MTTEQKTARIMADIARSPRPPIREERARINAAREARMYRDAADALGTIRCVKCGKSCMLKMGHCPACYREICAPLAADAEQARRDAFDSKLADRYE